MPSAGRSTRTELRVGLLIDGSGSAPREDVAVVLDGTSIASVTAWPDRAPHRPDNVVDLRDATVTPGLIDAHAHLCWGSPTSTAWRSIGDTPDALVAWGLASGAAALAAGITTVIDCGSPHGLALRVRNLIGAGVATGPQVLASGAAITTTGGHGEFIGTTADDETELRVAVRRLVAQGADLIKVMATGGATDPHTNRRAAQYSEAELRVLTRDAHRLGRMVVGHANATAGISAAASAGVDVIAHCNWLGTEPGTVVVDFAAVDQMAAGGCYVDLNLQGARRSLLESDGRVLNWALPNQPGNRWELLAPLREKGIGIYLSSDAFGPAIGSFPADLASAAAEWGLPIEELVHRVTGLPAAAMRLTGRGLVQPGHVADLVVYRGDLRNDPGAMATPSRVYRDGAVAAADGLLAPPGVARAHRTEASAQARLIETVLDELG